MRTGPLRRCGVSYHIQNLKSRSQARFPHNGVIQSLIRIPILTMLPIKESNLSHRRVFCLSDLLCITIQLRTTDAPVCFCAPSIRGNLALFEMYSRNRETMMECDLEPLSYINSGEPIGTLTDALNASQWTSPPPCDKYWYWLHSIVHPTPSPSFRYAYRKQLPTPFTVGLWKRACSGQGSIPLRFLVVFFCCVICLKLVSDAQENGL